MQDKDHETLDENNLNIVTNKKPTSKEKEDLIFAFKVAKHVKSNAIIYAKNNSTFDTEANRKNIPGWDFIQFSDLRVGESELVGVNTVGKQKFLMSYTYPNKLQATIT